MQKLKDKLKAIAKSLTALSKEVEKATKQLGKVKPAAAPAKKKKAAPAKKAKTKKAAAKKAAPEEKAAAAKKLSVLDSVFDTIKKSRKGATIAELKQKTGLNPRQISNALYKLSKRDLIVSAARGVYTKK